LTAFAPAAVPHTLVAVVAARWVSSPSRHRLCTGCRSVLVIVGCRSEEGEWNERSSE
ncbi:hypothetical protein Dimus_022130, partial [Dionaea muscipula]